MMERGEPVITAPQDKRSSALINEGEMASANNQEAFVMGTRLLMAAWHRAHTCAAVGPQLGLRFVPPALALPSACGQGTAGVGFLWG